MLRTMFIVTLVLVKIQPSSNMALHPNLHQKSEILFNNDEPTRLKGPKATELLCYDMPPSLQYSAGLESLARVTPYLSGE